MRGHCLGDWLPGQLYHHPPWPCRIAVLGQHLVFSVGLQKCSLVDTAFVPGCPEITQCTGFLIGLRSYNCVTGPVAFGDQALPSLYANVRVEHAKGGGWSPGLIHKGPTET